MKISHRLIIASAFSAAGLACVAAVSYVAVTSIQSDLQQLTLQATPLQNKSYELQQRMEKMLSTLLRVSTARSKEEAHKGAADINSQMQAFDKLRVDIQALDADTKMDLAPMEAARKEIVETVGKRLDDEITYRRDANNARDVLKEAAEAISRTTAAIREVGAQAGKTADKAKTPPDV